MRKFDYCLSQFAGGLLILLSFAASQNASAQLYVSPGSYVFVNNQYVTVTQDVNLQNNGNFFLRNESQLLQKTAGSSANSGSGSLSVFQEGTSNNYSYNYWCSPVGNTVSGTGNGAFGVSLLYRPTGLTSSSSATILPSSVLDGTTNNSGLSIAERWIYKLLSSTTYSQWIYVGPAASINAGEGFTMKGVSGTDATTVLGVQNNPGSNQRYDFRGRPNDGNIGVSVISAANNMTLTGNPYPSAIDLNLFLTDPANTPYIDGTALFWEHDPAVASHYIASYKGGYGVYNGTTSVYTPATFYNYDAAGNQTTVASTPMHYFQRRFSPVGQGFMVRGIAPGTATFKNSYRVYVKEAVANNSEFHRESANVVNNSDNTVDYYPNIPNTAGTDYTQISKLPTPHININASLNNTAVRQIALCFLPTAIDGVDRADTQSADTSLNLPFDMYFSLNDLEYIHSTTSFDINKRFPVGFKNNTPATFRIQVADFINFTGAENVYLYDKQTGNYHDIRNSEYEMALPSGISNNRFEITFLDANLANENVADTGGFDIVQNNSKQLLSIANPKMADLKAVTLYDITGRQVFSKTELGSKNEYQFSTSGLSDAVYIVKVSTTNQDNVAKKITITNHQ